MTVSLEKATTVYDEIIDLIASGASSEDVLKFKLSEAAQERIEDLVWRHKTGELETEEKKELDEFFVLEHIMRLAKARALKYISTKSNP